MAKATPSLFGVQNSNRDFSSRDSWSKNKFNSSFPASLIAYMDSKGLPCIYLTMDGQGDVVKKTITAKELFGKSPLDPNLYYSFESAYTPFQPITIGKPPTVDLMLMDNTSTEVLSGYEIKLTTLPDESTHKLTEDEYGCELVIRMPSIHFLACSLSKVYKGKHRKLAEYFGKNGFGNVASYVEAAQINPQLGEISKRLNDLIFATVPSQEPFMIQPIWKTNGKTGILADQCFDVFVWSDMAFT